MRTALAGLAALVLATSAASAQAVKTRIAYVPVIGAAPLFVLTGAGWARETGLDVSLIKFESGPPAINALASGTIDALAIGLAPVAVARAKGLDTRVVAAMATGGSGFVAASSLAAAFDRQRGDVAKSFADFHLSAGRPAKLATVPSGGVPNVALNHWLFALNNVARGDAQIVALGIDAVQQALLSGAVDGGTALEPGLTITLARDPRLKMIATADQMFEGIPGVVLAVSGPFAKAYPEAVDRLVALNARANAFIAANTDQAADFVQPALGGGLVDKATFARALVSKAVRFVADPAAIVEPARRMLDYEATIGDFDKPPPVDGLIDASVYARVAAH